MLFDLDTDQTVDYDLWAANLDVAPDNVKYYDVASVAIDTVAVSVDVGVLALDTGADPVARQQATLAAAAVARLLRTPVLAADVSADITAEQTATSGAVGSVTKTGAGWTADVLIDKVIVFTGGTNGNADGTVRAVVTDNTTDTITFLPAFGSACDATTTFKVFASAFELLKRASLVEAMAVMEYDGSLV